MSEILYFVAARPLNGVPKIAKAYCDKFYVDEESARRDADSLTEMIESATFEVYEIEVSLPRLIPK